MKQAIEKAIYYSAVIPNHYSTPIARFVYSNRKEFYDIINSLSDNIDVIAMFAPKGDRCYKIFTYLSYEDLLLDKTTSLFLVNRQDYCIELIRKTDDEDSSLEKPRIAILKVDSVQSELKERSYLYPGLVLIGGIIGLGYYYNFNES